MVKLALVGAGWQGQGHLQTLKGIKEAHLVGLCDISEEILRKASDKFKVKGFNDYFEMLDVTNPDGIIICTPPAIREHLIREAAERGIHCFIEKPPAKSLEAARTVNEILEQTGVINSVGFMYRYSSAVEYTKQLIKGKRIALVRSAMLDGLALRPNWPRWFFDKSRSGGPVFDQAIHMFDLSRYLFGEVDIVTGYQNNIIVPKSEDFTVEDSVTLSMKYENGILQNHLHSWSYPDVFTKIELFSDELTLSLDLARGSVEGTLEGERVLFEAKNESLYRLELEAFIKALKENNREYILSTYKDSIHSLSFAIKALKALEKV